MIGRRDFGMGANAIESDVREAIAEMIEDCLQRYLVPEVAQSETAEEADNVPPSLQMSADCNLRMRRVRV